MDTYRDTISERQLFLQRLWVAGLVVFVGFTILIARHFWLAVVQYKYLSAQSRDNHIALAPIVPNRGLILDRNGETLATEVSSYTLEITPGRVRGNLEDLINQLGQLVEIHPANRRLFHRQREETKNLESVPIRNRLSDEEVARVAAQLFRFEGVEIKARLFRSYPFGETASHVLGYVSSINKRDLEIIAAASDAANYVGTLNIGKRGVEQSYEKELHGISGFEEVEVSAAGRPVRRLHSTPAIAGNTLVLSIDIHLQKLVEQLYGNRRGSLVALDPASGEVLAMVSKPNFDPNHFVGGIDNDQWAALNESPDHPLLNRAINGTYPPGSTYKPFMALIGLETGKRTASQTISDPGYFNFGGNVFRDDKEGGHGPAVDMRQAIAQSCDTYFYVLANDMGVDLIHDAMAPFGFGARTGIDLIGESTGVLPSTTWKKNYFKKRDLQKWYAGETISLGIGQGYNAFTIMQLATATATLANHGQRMVPRLVREVRDPVTGTVRQNGGKIAQQQDLQDKHLQVIHQAMVDAALPGGTAGIAFKGASYVAAAKTGTAQVYSLKGEKYVHHRVGERLRDHALFIAFAPVDKPKIALAMVVENAGFGAQAAAPIARKVFDYALTGVMPSDQEMAKFSAVSK